MSTVATNPTNLTPSRTSERDSSRRLWPALAHPRARIEPTRGADTIGEFALGFIRRTRARRLDWKRARSIQEDAQHLASGAEAVFNDAIARVRESAILRRSDDATIDAVFAVATAAIRREIGLTLHVEQVLGALAMAQGCCAELATGEGKTLTAILPASLDGFVGRGVHVITVNDYLARRDAEITTPAYRRMGLSVGVIQEASTPDERRTAYDAAITYLADKQAIFDHLKDRLVAPISPRTTGAILDDLVALPHDARDTSDHRSRSVSSNYRPDWSRLVVHRGLHAAIIDEADSVLIDDAVTPAVISGAVATDESDTSHFSAAAALARDFEQGKDYIVERRLRRTALTDVGRRKLSLLSHTLPAPWSGPRRSEELLTQALSAKEIYHKGEDYIVRDNKIEIVDRSTGRVLPGRQWQLGVHQAIEAKEGLDVSRERYTSARCSYQDFFQRYRHLSGMSGTAQEVASELWRWYRLPVVPVPTHKPIARTRARDRVHSTLSQKFDAVASRVEALHKQGRPILIGTRSITASEHLASILRKRGINCDVLNADREAEEATIVARAGRSGAVTVATNMAGRGTDIQLDADTRAAGGLAVIATERNDESRVDRQLFGRSGRQGDPGSAEMFVSLEDAIIAQHGLRSLIAFVRVAGPLSAPAAWLLWRGAQWAASRKWKSLRAETAKLEAWQDMALHQLTR